jgi:hypothetical protein
MRCAVTLNQENIAIVSGFLNGARRAKFLASIAILESSLKDDSWAKRGSVKVESGFYQGLVRCRFAKNYEAKNQKAQDEAWALSYCLSFGNPFRGTDVDLAITTYLEFYKQNKLPFKVPVEVLHAWVSLCGEKAEAKTYLNGLRPKPVITPVGLSPKVTKTLKEMNLDLELSTIKMAEIVSKQVPAIDSTFKPLFNSDGTRKMDTIWYVKWSKDIKLRATRFTSSRGCEACGRPIPSRRFVPVEAKDQVSGQLIGMWIGCDCAKNIFGIKDIGIAKDE